MRSCSKFRSSLVKLRSACSWACCFWADIFWSYFLLSSRNIFFSTFGTYYLLISWMLLNYIKSVTHINCSQIRWKTVTRAINQSMLSTSAYKSVKTRICEPVINQPSSNGPPPLGGIHFASSRVDRLRGAWGISKISRSEEIDCSASVWNIKPLRTILSPASHHSGCVSFVVLYTIYSMKKRQRMGEQRLCESDLLAKQQDRNTAFAQWQNSVYPCKVTRSR